VTIWYAIICKTVETNNILHRLDMLGWARGRLVLKYLSTLSIKLHRDMVALWTPFVIAE